MIGTLRQRHDLSMMASAAILRGIGRVHCNVAPASFFRFAGQFAEKFRPRGIMNTLSETMVMSHAVDLQVFHADDPITIHKTTAFLVREVVTAESNPFMYPRNCFTVFSSLS